MTRNYKEMALKAVDSKKEKVLDQIKFGGDDGVTKNFILGKLGWTPNGLDSVIAQLIKSGQINKHRTLEVYFFNPPWEEAITEVYESSSLTNKQDEVITQLINRIEKLELLVDFIGKSMFNEVKSG